MLHLECFLFCFILLFGARGNLKLKHVVIIFFFSNLLFLHQSREFVLWLLLSSDLNCLVRNQNGEIFSNRPHKLNNKFPNKQPQALDTVLLSNPNAWFSKRSQSHAHCAPTKSLCHRPYTSIKGDTVHSTHSIIIRNNPTTVQNHHRVASTELTAMRKGIAERTNENRFRFDLDLLWSRPMCMPRRTLAPFFSNKNSDNTEAMRRLYDFVRILAHCVMLPDSNFDRNAWRRHVGNIVERRRRTTGNMIIIGFGADFVQFSHYPV